MPAQSDHERHYHVQDPDEIVYASEGPDGSWGLSENVDHAAVLTSDADALALRDRLDPILGPLVIVAFHPSSGASCKT